MRFSILSGIFQSHSGGRGRKFNQITYSEVQALCDQDISIENFSFKEANSRVHTKSDHNFSSYIYSQENCISGLYLFSAAVVIKDHLLKGLFNCSLAAEHSVLAGSVIALALRGYVLCSQRLCHLAGEEAKRGERVNHFSIDFLWI